MQCGNFELFLTPKKFTQVEEKSFVYFPGKLLHNVISKT